MDQALNDRWQKAQSPFDGATLDFDEALAPEIGQRLVPWLLELLDQQIGLAETLLINEDWH